MELKIFQPSPTSERKNQLFMKVSQFKTVELLNYNSCMWFLLGDLMDEESVLEFLTSLEALDLPDRIEEVNSKILQKIIEDTDYVAVLFCE